MQRPPRILVIEDEAIVAADIRRTLMGMGYEVLETADSAKEAIDRATASRPDLALVDIHIKGDLDGIQTAEILRERFRVPVIYLTAFADETTVERAKWTEPVGYLLKPIKALELRSVVEVGLYKHAMETRLREREHQLEAANADLEAFNYTVAHDLRTPLTVIIGYSETLVLSAAKLDEAGTQQLLERIAAVGNRMAQTIDDLLKLATLTRVELKRTSTDLGGIAREVAEGLRQQQAAQVVDLSIAEPTLGMGDPGLLRSALENLLGNAFKFTSKQPNPKIEFGSVQKDGETIYFVRDNGAGFDMASTDKLFAPFQRLHKQNEYEGTGIGLACVQRIIQRHGGRIWAESTPGEGATFWFSLNESQDSETVTVGTPQILG